MTWFDPQTTAACLSAIAAIAAAIATWRGPLAAAKMADSLKVRSDQLAFSRQIRLNVFITLMQSRAEIWDEAAVRALNMIDVAFSESDAVREAWSELYQSFNSNPPAHVTEERLRRLLKAMAADLGISDKLRQDDFARVYFPTALLEERNVKALERKAALERLTGQTSPIANSALSESLKDKWPPKPFED